MITANEMLQRMGKDGFVRYVSNASGHGERQIDVERRRSRGRVKHRRCEHGVWIIDNYEAKPCKDCVPYGSTKLRDFEPHFNLGLGCYVESRSEMKRIAKAQKMIHIGNDRVR